MTPAVTLDRTASMNARRVSTWALAARNAPVCSSSRPLIRLKAVASVCTSSSDLRHRHPGGEVAFLDPPRGRDQLAQWANHSVGKASSAAKIASPTMISAPSSKAALKRSWLVRERSSKAR